MTPEMARAQLRAHKLRVTAPRIAVLCALADAKQPLSYTEVAAHLKEVDFDPTTIYRNLVKLKEAGIAKIVSRVDGVNRYTHASTDQNDHRHPHFVCDDCGYVACLPADLIDSMKLEGPWSTPIRLAQVQLRGECPECINAD